MLSGNKVKISDRELWALLKSGDDRAYRYLFKNYYPAMCVAAYSYVNDDFASEALVDDVIYHIWKSRESLDVKSSLKAYLLISVRNKCLEYLRSAAVAKKETLSDYENAAGYSEKYGIEDELIGKELYEMLEKAIGQLPDETRRVFELSRYYGYSYEKIASELGISVNTVKYHIKRALAILKNKFSEYFLFIILFYTTLNRF